MIALLLSSVVIILVSTTFLVQNRYYSTQVLASGAHDNARAATELMATELRSVMESGIKTAGARTLTIRTPLTMIAACYTGSGAVDAYIDGGLAGLDTAEIAGVARRDMTTGNWTYANATWSALQMGGGDPAGSCYDEGADTVGFYNDYYRFAHSGFSGLGSGPFDQDVLMLFRETTFKFQTSVMDTTTMGLFRQAYGDSLIEFATGMDTTSQFQYRTGANYSDTVTSFSLRNIDVIRIVADARKRAETGGAPDVTFGWSVNVALRNRRSN